MTKAFHRSAEPTPRSARLSPKWSRRHGSKCVAIGALIAIANLLPRAAAAEESAYCRKVRARAAADAALLLAPKIIAEGLKLPAGLQPGARLDATAQGAGYQLRGGLSFSAVHAYKAFATTDVAAADCVQHEQTLLATELLNAPESFRLNALRKQIEFLDSRRPEIDDLVAKMGDRLAVQTVTALELEDLRERASVLARKRTESAAEMARIESLGWPTHRGSIDQLIRDIEASSMKFERKVSHLRSLDAWELAVTGGYIPKALSQGASDFFGVIQVSYSLGGPWHTAAESRYLDARADELRSAQYELRHALEIFRRQVKAVTARAESELAIADKRLAEIRALREALTSSTAASAPVVLARLAIELVGVEAERLFLVELVSEISRLEGGN